MGSYWCSMTAFLSSSSLVDISEFVLYVLYWAKINKIRYFFYYHIYIAKKWHSEHNLHCPPTIKVFKQPRIIHMYTHSSKKKKDSSGCFSVICKACSYYQKLTPTNQDTLTSSYLLEYWWNTKVYPTLHQKVKDTDVNSCSQVVNVGNEYIFFAMVQQRLKYAGVIKALVDIAVAWRIPPVCVCVKKRQNSSRAPIMQK